MLSLVIYTQIGGGQTGRQARRRVPPKAETPSVINQRTCVMSIVDLSTFLRDRCLREKGDHAVILSSRWCGKIV
jgi:hypothetical protein